MSELTDEGLRGLLAQFRRYEDLRFLTDAQLAELLLEEVWGDLSPTDQKCAVVEQAVDRLRRSAGDAFLGQKTSYPRASN